MNALLKKLIQSGLGLALIFSAPILQAETEQPEVSHDGLVRTGDSKTDIAYMLPEADFSIYEKIIILEPTISFKKKWQSRTNSNRPLNRISNRDMERMIEEGQMLLYYAFEDVLTEGGYDVVKEVGDNVLTIRPMIINLDIAAPDPNNNAAFGPRVYTRSAGEATLFFEAYDSVTGQILLRAFDTKGGQRGRNGTAAFPRTQNSNKIDARRAFKEWATLLVEALDHARKIKDKEKSE